jgi:resuscitation-promoting factor RpfB
LTGKHFVRAHDHVPDTREGFLPHWLPPWLVWLVGILLVMASVGLGFFIGTQRVVRLEINGVHFSHRTHQTTVPGVLDELGIVLHPADVLEAPASLVLLSAQLSLPSDGVPQLLASTLSSEEPIVVRIARPVYVLHDGALSAQRTHAQDVDEALRGLGVSVSAHDQLSLDQAACTLATPWPAPVVGRHVTPAALVSALRRPMRIALQRAIDVRVQDGATERILHTTAPTVGEALSEAGIPIYAADQVLPSLDAGLGVALTVYIQRSTPLFVDIGGSLTIVRTQATTASAVLDELGLTLEASDYVLPNPNASIEEGMRVSLVRVHEERYLEETPIGYEIRYEPDPTLDIDNRAVSTWGREGARRRLVTVRYENGQELYRSEQESWIAQEPIDRVIRYGTQITVRTLQTASGPIEYWRHLRMLATSYSPSTAGVSRSASYFGLTRLGIPATHGMVAVDPRVINLRQHVYVPGYGQALAADTGGAIKWRRIDLCYDDDNLVLWRRWVDVYVLTPIPSSDRITWIIPNQPVERE